MQRALLSFAGVGALIGLPALVLQRWVAETRFAAIVLVLAWFAVVGIGLVFFVWRRRDLRLPVLGAFALILAGTVAVGYWTGFRDMVVDEDVAMAASRATAEQRERGLSGERAAEARPEAARTGGARQRPRSPAPTATPGPVSRPIVEQPRRRAPAHVHASSTSIPASTSTSSSPRARTASTTESSSAV